MIFIRVHIEITFRSSHLFLLDSTVLNPLPHQLSLFLILSSSIVLHTTCMLTPKSRPLTDLSFEIQIYLSILSGISGLKC